MEQAHNFPAWFKDDKFGMFIHWGPYSILGGEWNGQQIEQGDIAEWIMQQFQIPVEEYRKVAATFNPTGFNAREWVSLAKKTGMKYIIITSKHHDGFAMYDSRVSDYNIVDYTPFKRDPIRELAEACAEAGIKFGVYYSHREDWEHPYAYGNFWDFDTSQTNLDTMDHPELFRRYLDEKSIPQLTELLTEYGPMGVVWFDRGMYTQEQGQEFADLVHDLQPGTLVNGRVGHYDKELLGDYQSMTDNGMPIGGIEEYWETPQTLNETWGYSRHDNNWKKPDEVIRRLVTIVSKGGNYLLNVGPTGQGIIPGPSVEILNAVGDWMQQNSESIYGTSPSPFPYELPWGYSTRKGNRLFLHVFDWPGNGQLNLDGLNNEIKQAYPLLNPEETLTVDRDEAGDLTIGLPAEPPDAINSVIVLEIEGGPDIDPYIVEQDEDDSVLLDYLSASTSGAAQKRFNRRGESGHFHISKMQTSDDFVEWHVQMNTPGTYHVDITYAARPGWEDARFVVEMGQQRIEGSVQSTQGWYEYKTERIGQLEVTSAGRAVVKIYPSATLDHYLMYFNKMELLPTEGEEVAESPKSDTPNIVVFLTDDLGYGDLGSYGNPIIKTPHIDQFAAEGVRMTDFHSGGTVCSPSRAALLTGRNPYRSGFFYIASGETYLKDDEVTIAEVLKTAGYETSFWGKWHLSELEEEWRNGPGPGEQGFDYWLGTTLNAFEGPENPKEFLLNGEPVGEVEGWYCDVIVDEAGEWLEKKRNKDKPFFMYVSSHEPHTPIAPPASFSEPYENDSIDALEKNVKYGGVARPDKDISKNKSAYYGTVTQLDEAFGRLMQKLKGLGLEENTIVILTSDNGPESPVSLEESLGLWEDTTRDFSFGTPGELRGMKRFPYEGGHRVPGIVRYPKVITAGTESNVLFNGTDILPTIAKLAAAKVPTDRPIDGVDAFNALLNKEVSREASSIWFYPNHEDSYFRMPQMSMRTGDYTLLGYLPETDDPTGLRNWMAENDPVRFELYDITTDPSQSNDISKEYPQVVASMKVEMISLWREMRDEGLSGKVNIQ